MLWPACFITQDPLAARQAVDVTATPTHNTLAMSSPGQGTVATSKTIWPPGTDRSRTLSNPGLDTVSRSPVTQHPTVHRLVSEAVVGAKVLSLSVLLRQSAVQGTQPMAYYWRARVFPLPPLSPLYEIRCCLGWLRTSLELAA